MLVDAGLNMRETSERMTEVACQWRGISGHAFERRERTAFADHDVVGGMLFAVTPVSGALQLCKQLLTGDSATWFDADLKFCVGPWVAGTSPAMTGGRLQIRRVQLGAVDRGFHEDGEGGGWGQDFSDFQDGTAAAIGGDGAPPFLGDGAEAAVGFVEVGLSNCVTRGHRSLTRSIPESCW